MAKLANLVKAISADDDPENNWEFWMEKSKEKLVVVDIHKKWCGPCEVMNPTFRGLFLNLDNAEHRVQFLTIDSSLAAALAEEHEDPSCKPLFKFFKDGKLEATVTGANGPAIESLVHDNVPEYDEDD